MPRCFSQSKPQVRQAKGVADSVPTCTPRTQACLAVLPEQSNYVNKSFTIKTKGDSCWGTTTVIRPSCFITSAGSSDETARPLLVKSEDGGAKRFLAGFGCSASRKIVTPGLLLNTPPSASPFLEEFQLQQGLPET